MTDDLVMNPSVRKALWEALLLLLAGCAPSLPEDGDNPQELRQRDVELECMHKATLANENQSYNQGTPFPFDQGSQCPSDHARALHGLSSINAMRDIRLAPKDYRVE
jgi:hypothetical protein